MENFKLKTGFLIIGINITDKREKRAIAYLETIAWPRDARLSGSSSCYKDNLNPG